jgi:cell division protein FtsN
MEKQKIFWVVLSVSVFVVIVLIVGVYLLRQKPAAAAVTPPGAVNPITGPGPQIFEYSQQNPQGQTGTGTGTGQTPGETQTMHFYIGEGGEKGQGTTPAQGTPPAQGTSPAQGTQPQAPGTLPVPTQPQATVIQPPAKVQPLAPTGPAVQVPVAAPHPHVVAAAPRKAQPPVKTAVKPRQARPSVDYWIQTGSYKSQSRADELVSRLADKGLPGKVFSYDSRGQTYYRVRIGPYANHGEADKFLSIVRQIQGLESSYVSQVGGLRNLN